MRVKPNRSPSWFRSSAGAVLTALCGYALFGALFHSKLPETQPVEHRAGKITLLPMKADDGSLQKWMRIHDPAAIVRGGKMPPLLPCPVPANAPRPEPEIQPAKAHMAEPGTRLTLKMDDTEAAAIPELRRRTRLPEFPALPPEIYPKTILNGKPFSAALPPELLRRAAAVNAGTAEFRITAGLLPEELRIAVIRSSGDTGIDREIAGCITAWKIPELPADCRVIWDAAGELDKK